MLRHPARFPAELNAFVLAHRKLDEAVSANICVQKRMKRFTLRTEFKVDIQWTRSRFALVHNIGKIHTFGAIH